MSEDRDEQEDDALYRTNRCENCRCKIPRDQWACDRCIQVFDGDRYHNELLDEVEDE